MAAELLHGSPDAQVLLTCEHASNALPDPWCWHEHDHWVVDTHWAWDPGAAALTRHLAAQLLAPAILATFSRLLIDVNRPVEHDDLHRAEADGSPIRLNHQLSHDERQARIRRFHEPYHDAIDRTLGAHPRAMVLSMHSFTPVYQGGAPRTMEIGVLFDRDEPLANRIAASLDQQGWAVALNEPYSGRGGLMYSADRHATQHGRHAIELEIRQDLAGDPSRHAAIVAAIRRALADAGVTSP